VPVGKQEIGRAAANLIKTDEGYARYCYLYIVSGYQLLVNLVRTQNIN